MGIEIKIQEDYWTGTKCLEYEVPWQTPKSIYYLSNLCDQNDTVLDLGTGGSTLFYARRCKLVISIETDLKWFQTVRSLLNKKNILNVIYLYLPHQKNIENLLESFTENLFNIASVDTVHKFNRSKFIDIVTSRNNIKTMVLDNYTSQSLFPEHYNKTKEQIIQKCFQTEHNNWLVEDFDDSKWHGSGTRIIHKRQDIISI